MKYICVLRLAKNTVNDLSMVSVVPKSRRLASQFPLFSPRYQQAAVGSLLRMEEILPNTSQLLNTQDKMIT